MSEQKINNHIKADYQKALFLDLDHTIIRPKSGGTFPKDKDDWVFVTRMMQSIQRVVNKGYLPIIVTNQGGIEAGYVRELDFLKKMEEITKEMKHLLSIPDIPFYYCTSTDETDYFRKPSPGMAYQAAIDHRLNLTPSIMVGDMESDQFFAQTASIGSFYFTSQFVY